MDRLGLRSNGIGASPTSPAERVERPKEERADVVGEVYVRGGCRSRGRWRARGLRCRRPEDLEHGCAADEVRAMRGQGDGPSSERIKFCFP